MTDPVASDRRLIAAIRISGVLSVALIASGVIMAWHFAPLLPRCDPSGTVNVLNCQTSPEAQKLFYIHVPIAFAAYLAFVAMAFCSWRHLDDRRTHWDTGAHAAAEVGVVAAGLTLATGMMWGKAEWDDAWNNADLKLVLTLVMFLFYVGYLVLRQQIDQPRRRARISAVYALLAFVTVPLSFVAHRLWRTTHPWVFGNPDPNAGIVTPWVEDTFVVNTAAFLALAIFLILVRYRVGRLEAAKTEATV